MGRARGCSLQQESPQAFAVVVGPWVKELILYSQRTEDIRSLFKEEHQAGKKKKSYSDPTCSKRCRNVGNGYRFKNDVGYGDVQGSF